MLPTTRSQCGGNPWSSPICFKDELGKLQRTTVKLHIDPKSVPKFCKAQPISFALKKKVESELQRLETEDVISPVCFSDWATPIIPVVKGDRSISICGDYKVTLNQVLKSEVYPLPRINELFAALAGGVKFTKLDLSHAYQQLVLEEEFAWLATITPIRDYLRISAYLLALPQYLLIFNG